MTTPVEANKVWLYYLNASTWEDASDVCNAWGGYLARINNQIEAQSMSTLIPNGNTWIGIKNPANQYPFIYQLTNQPIAGVTWWAGSHNPLILKYESCYYFSPTNMDTVAYACKDTSCTQCAQTPCSTSTYAMCDLKDSTASVPLTCNSTLYCTAGGGCCYYWCNPKYTCQ